MATIKSFEDIEAWQKARILAKHVYALTLKASFNKDYSLKDQINRSSGSVMDNIAEGFERDGSREFLQFLSYAKGSAGEVRSQLYRALDRSHIEEQEFERIFELTQEVSRMLTGFMSYLQRTHVKGSKFH